MPELPEVETTRRGIAPHLLGRRLTAVVVRQRQLRWPVPEGLEARLTGQRVDAIERRAKYLLLHCGDERLIVHLGMSGSLRIHRGVAPLPGLHDHVDLQFGSRLLLRYTDPRRFGAMLLADGADRSHALLRDLGPEPLDATFDGELLYRRARGRRVAAKALIMDSRIVVGVGNIYANEALFRAGIRPQRRAGRLSRRACTELAVAIKAVLAEAIEAGGTTLRDFVGGDGRPGYFRMALAVYGRGGEPCVRCGSPLRETRVGQRSTVYCPRCQR